MNNIIEKITKIYPKYQEQIDRFITDDTHTTYEIVGNQKIILCENPELYRRLTDHIRVNLPRHELICNGYKNIKITGDWDYAILKSGGSPIEYIHKEINDTFTVSYNYMPIPKYHEIWIDIYDIVNKGENAIISYDMIYNNLMDTNCYFPYTDINYDYYRMNINTPESIYLPPMAFSEIIIKIDDIKPKKIYLLLDTINEYESIVPFKYNKKTNMWALNFNPFVNYISSANIEFKTKLLIYSNKEHNIMNVHLYTKFHNIGMLSTGMYGNMFSM